MAERAWWTGQPDWVKTAATAEWVAQTAATSDPALRNLRVTRGYQGMSEALAGLLGRDNANWCTFGVWASRSVGDILRGDAMPSRIRRFLTDEHDMMGDLDAAARVAPLRHRLFSRWLGVEQVSRALSDTALQTATELSKGNTAVYLEIGNAITTYLSVWREREPGDPGAAEASLAGTDGAVVVLGQNRLRLALEAWNDALLEADPRRRAQLILAGSLQMGAHEQWRLQGAITGALGGGVDLLAMPFIEHCVPIGRIRALRPLARRLMSHLDPVLHRAWDRLTAHTVMTVEVPGESLSLGRDVPPPKGTARLVPPDLDQIVDERLAAAVDAFDRATADGRGSAADDWTDYAQRMNFILWLFRSRQQVERLFEPPFIAAAAADIDAGRLPKGDILAAFETS